MGITNIRYGLEEKIGRFRGELEAKRAEVKQIENGVLRPSDLHTEITELERADQGRRSDHKTRLPRLETRASQDDPSEHRPEAIQVG